MTTTIVAAATIDTRLATANRVLADFTIVQIERRASGMHVSWTSRTNSGDERISRRWQTRGQDFYPVWNRIYPHGGTSVTALSQLIRWCYDRPVLPLATWEYWASDTVKLLDRETVEILRAGGYPEIAKCVLCNREIDGSLDWWSLRKVTGPCCGWTTGCRQKQPAAAPTPFAISKKTDSDPHGVL